jgi:hypothetical protein
MRYAITRAPAPRCHCVHSSFIGVCYACLLTQRLDRRQAPQPLTDALLLRIIIGAREWREQAVGHIVAVVFTDGKGEPLALSSSGDDSTRPSASGRILACLVE